MPVIRNANKAATNGLVLDFTVNKLPAKTRDVDLMLAECCQRRCPSIKPALCQRIVLCWIERFIPAVTQRWLSARPTSVTLTQRCMIQLRYWRVRNIYIYCRSDYIREVLISVNSVQRTIKNLAKIINIIALLERKKSRILNFLKSPKIRNSRKLKHAKITRSTVYRRVTQINLSWWFLDLCQPE